MHRCLGALLVGLAAVAVAQAHALFILPDGDKVMVIFHHELAPDPNVKEATWKRFETIELTARTADGKRTPVKWEKGQHCLTAKPAAGTVVVTGQVSSVAQKADAKPKLSVQRPKVVLSGPADKPVTDGLEILAAKEAGKVRFRAVLAGKPLAGVKVAVLQPTKMDEEESVTTDEQGWTPGFEGSGRYGVTVRYEEAKAGEQGGQKYEATSHVATLVIDVK